MHFISELRYNARTQSDDWYYRIKESFRDRTGRARCRIMLNVGFIDEPHMPEDIRDIGKCLNHLHRHQGETDMFGGPLVNCNAFVQREAAECWRIMVDNGSIDTVKATMEDSVEKARRLVDVDTVRPSPPKRSTHLGRKSGCGSAASRTRMRKRYTNN